MIIRYAKGEWSVYLTDMGNLDTHIGVQHTKLGEICGEATFSHEYASRFRNRKGELTKSGLRALAIEVIDSIERW